MVMPLPDMKALALFLLVPKPGFFTFPSAGRGDPLSSVLVICEPVS